MQTSSSTSYSTSRAECVPNAQRYVCDGLKSRQVALITGGGSGIGLMAAQALAVNGARVYIVGRTERKLQTAAEVHGNNIAGGIIPLRGDVSDKDDIK